MDSEIIITIVIVIALQQVQNPILTFSLTPLTVVPPLIAITININCFYYSN